MTSRLGDDGDGLDGRDGELDGRSLPAGRSLRDCANTFAKSAHIINANKVDA
jgi:hypothetical protein